MFQLDEKFLNDLGLDKLPEGQHKAFLQHIYDELEIRVGTKLSEGLNDAQLNEFELIAEKDVSTINNWLNQFVPDYATRDDFIRLKNKASVSSDDDINLKGEYTATQWLEKNRPDYKKVVEETLSDLKNEIIAERDEILG
jgi:hypothetical protein